MKNFIVTVDSREQKGWTFDPEEKKPGRCQLLGSEVGCLDAADYAIKGHENLIRIERKMGLRELFGNYTPVENKERFVREMEKLREVKYKYLVIESNLGLDIMSLSVQQFKYPVPASKVIEWIYDLQQEYGIVPIFAGDAGKKIARQLFELVIKKEL